MTDEIRTERLLLRRWRDEDVAPFADLNADPEVMRYFPSVLDLEATRAFVERIERHFLEHGVGLWAVDIDGHFAGFTGLNHTTFDTPMGPHVEIGWRYARWAWGKGYATEAARAVLDVASAEGLSVVYSFTTESNARSEAVMQRIGMTRQPEFDFDHPRTPDWWGRRHIVYSIDLSGGRSARNT